MTQDRMTPLWFARGLPRCSECGRPLTNGHWCRKRPSLARPHSPDDLRLRENAARRRQAQEAGRREYLERRGI